VTLFGDALAVFSEGIWLQDLIDLLAPFEINERLVRTSVFRLAEEGWLQAHRQGRRSRYALTASGARRFAHASRRIYAPPPADWSGDWTVVLLPKTLESPAVRADLRRDLEWEGFGMLSSGVFLHPLADVPVLREILQEHGVDERSLVVRGPEPGHGGSAVGTLVGECWDLEGIAQGYAGFHDRFAPLLECMQQHGWASPQDAFMTQTLLIHNYRRVTLHDPRLPVALLPAAWPGLRAYATCREIYGESFGPTAAYLSQAIGASGLALPAPRGDLLQRFGGLDRRRLRWRPAIAED
jgi:phenylacetic acid degradation operon negative regulatory protein